MGLSLYDECFILPSLLFFLPPSLSLLPLSPYLLSLYRSTVVTITITDYNDNPPVLSSEEYNLTLSESTAVNTLHNLYTSYTDADSGDNAVVDYAIEGTGGYVCKT